jgi:proteasome lid subunit RPN8/RPN11
MLGKVISIPRRARNLVWTYSGSEVRAKLESLCGDLAVDLRKQVRQLRDFNDSYSTTEAFHLAVENLSNVYGSINQFIASHPADTAEDAVTFLDNQISSCKALLRCELISVHSQASEAVHRTLNLLFAAKQRIKSRAFLVSPNPLQDISDQIENTLPIKTVLSKKTLSKQGVPSLKLHSSLLYQLQHSLFPAERMIVAAGMQENDEISISAVFDVTGKASVAGVHADPERLARALISMAETDTYLVAWLHSHPGAGPEATYPSAIDLGQEADWLKDYSPLLISAIMVRNGFIRFWGKALEDGKVAVQIEGPGIQKCSDSEDVYRLLN